MENKKFNLIILYLVLFISIGCTKNHMHHKNDKKNAINIHVQSAWIRAVPPASMMSAAYMRIMNHGKIDDRLLSVSTNISKVSEIHNVIKKDGMMKMMPVKFIDIPSGSSLDLKPGGFHIMLIKLLKNPKVGERYSIILNFENTGIINVIAEVKDSAGKMIEHDHGKM